MNKLRAALAILLVTSSVASAQEAPARATGIAIVLASSLNVRAQPRLDGAVLGAVVRGDTVCVLGVESDWLHVRVRSPKNSPATDAENDVAALPPALVGYASRGFLSERRLSADDVIRAGCGP